MKEEGVECKGCHAYWHYPCAGVTQAIIDEEWGAKDFMCKEHDNRVLAVSENANQGCTSKPANN